MEREVPAGQFWGLPPGQAVQDPPLGQTVWGPPWVRVSRVLTESSVSAAPDDPAHPAPLWSSLSSIQIIPVGNNALSPHQKQLFFSDWLSFEQILWNQVAWRVIVPKKYVFSSVQLWLFNLFHHLLTGVFIAWLFSPPFIVVLCCSLSLGDCVLWVLDGGLCLALLYSNYVCTCMLSSIRLCDPMNCCLPGSSVHGILQAKILEWVAINPLQGFFLTQGSNPCSCVFCTAGGSFTAERPGKLAEYKKCSFFN